ncbi:hypothetical protein SAMN05443549_102321 [Flavobacterium fluvii]|uniref:Uncharacterized protein n=1 Tax=Flavobacterium fluvii TaxID=468056 RepID=A0A1M5HPD0_9FLAO|nr:hypothetical protein [Flavobacterium fluvii]SHG17813.1 hypothetical protein SAMN05443549_102321 [Flavobacterium fluvii]
MKSYFNLLFVSSLLFISCKKELEPQDSKTPSKIVPFTEAANTQQNQTVMPAQTPQNQTTVNQNTAVTSPVAVAKGMNPAHGQPGHRCDIAVGAPLNSPVVPAKSNPVTTQSAPQQNSATSTTTATPAVTTPTPEGMNPPHGQENHRCDIAVGAPLPKE